VYDIFENFFIRSPEIKKSGGACCEATVPAVIAELFYPYGIIADTTGSLNKTINQQPRIEVEPAVR
jgi:hypothetical protein